MPPYGRRTKRGCPLLKTLPLKHSTKPGGWSPLKSSTISALTLLYQQLKFRVLWGTNIQSGTLNYPNAISHFTILIRGENNNLSQWYLNRHFQFLIKALSKLGMEGYSPTEDSHVKPVAHTLLNDKMFSCQDEDQVRCPHSQLRCNILLEVLAYANRKKPKKKCGGMGDSTVT